MKKRGKQALESARGWLGRKKKLWEKKLRRVGGRPSGKREKGGKS